MKEISVVCIYYNHNYGSILQSYALNHYLEKNGFKVNVIPFKDVPGKKEKIDVFLRLRLSKTFDLSIVKRKVAEYKNKKIYSGDDEEYKNGAELRNRTYERFIKTHFDVPENDIVREQLPDYVSNSRAVIVGSDQLWTPHDILIGYHTLEFVPAGIKRVSYATSFGVSELPNRYLKKRAKKFLKDLDYISVREDKGKKIIDELEVGKKVSVVSDPTMLLSRSEWDEILPEERIVKDKYIFCYFLGNNTEHRELAKEFKKKTGWQIIALQHMDEYIQSDRDFADKALYDIDPFQFAALIRDAELVLTDSFHGSVFSILYHKKFFVMNRHKDAEVRSTNSRIETLCSTFDLNDRRICDFDNAAPETLLCREIDYTTVDRKLENKRRESETFLLNALED
ncbi:MAG: polysaccharide pyruvyl transferase family protein [Ruminococcus sp.]|nr:polysaccharide pyruvyl transferase family protein [Ruminococcus sp.]